MSGKAEMSLVEICDEWVCVRQSRKNRTVQRKVRTTAMYDALCTAAYEAEVNMVRIFLRESCDFNRVSVTVEHRNLNQMRLIFERDNERIEREVSYFPR